MVAYPRLPIKTEVSSIQASMRFGHSLGALLMLPLRDARATPGGVIRNDGPSAIHLKRGNERFLRDVDLAELPHLLLAFLLLLQKFALTRDVAAIAFCGDVLAQRAHGFARDHLAADRGLDRNLEHVRRDQFLHPLDPRPAAGFG